MVGSFLQGGLGNYMFQIAVAHSIALDNNTIAVFDKQNVIQVHKNIDEYTSNILRNINFKDKPNYNTIYNEPSFEYNPITYSYGLFLFGYFQSEKYFSHNREKIISLFEPTEYEKKYIMEKYGNLLKTKNCSIHVRRGDYVKIQDIHVLCTIDYYNESTNIIGKDINYIIFSDDITWCKENLKFKNCYFVENEKDYIEIYLMSMCDNNIIANSSFSWWGAWLNQNENKTVIAPKNWFGGSKINYITKDIYGEKWFVI